MARFQILEDGPEQWVLVDNTSDDPCPVYTTRAAAEAALAEQTKEDE
jgi:hypothetical protein